MPRRGCRDAVPGSAGPAPPPPPSPPRRPLRRARRGLAAISGRRQRKRPRLRPGRRGQRPPWGGCGRPGGGCCGGCGAPRGCGRPAGSTRSPAASSWGWAPPPSSWTGNRAGGEPGAGGAAPSHAAAFPSCVSVRYLHVLMVFWSFVAGVVTFYCSLGPDSLLPNFLFTIKYKPKVNMPVKSLLLLKNTIRIYME